MTVNAPPVVRADLGAPTQLPLPADLPDGLLVLTLTEDRAGASVLAVWHANVMDGAPDRPLAILPTDAHRWTATGARRVWLHASVHGVRAARFPFLLTR